MKLSLKLGSTLSRNEIKVIKGSTGSNLVKVTKDNLIQVNNDGVIKTCCAFVCSHSFTCLYIGDLKCDDNSGC
ncbi:MAG: hypothetical protein QM528_06680 [Phycisphaerales bacterium]|nr:hypothetical protein [Phycisphaerales bacterium]